MLLLCKILICFFVFTSTFYHFPFLVLSCGAIATETIFLWELIKFSEMNLKHSVVQLYSNRFRGVSCLCLIPVLGDTIKGWSPPGPTSIWIKCLFRLPSLWVYLLTFPFPLVFTLFLPLSSLVGLLKTQDGKCKEGVQLPADLERKGCLFPCCTNIFYCKHKHIGTYKTETYGASQWVHQDSRVWSENVPYRDSCPRSIGVHSLPHMKLQMNRRIIGCIYVWLSSRHTSSEYLSLSSGN